mgnify:CR=1 FL=1
MNGINLTGREFLFYTGLVIMAAALILMVICVIVFILSGRRLKEQLRKEYGDPLS